MKLLRTALLSLAHCEQGTSRQAAHQFRCGRPFAPNFHIHSFTLCFPGGNIYDLSIIIMSSTNLLRKLVLGEYLDYALRYRTDNSNRRCFDFLVGRLGCIRTLDRCCRLPDPTYRLSIGDFRAFRTGRPCYVSPLEKFKRATPLTVRG